MIIRKYGIELHRLQNTEDVDLVRLKRNSAHVRSGMFFQDEITFEMQQKWFASQNTAENYHFIIHAEGRKTGMISGKKVCFNTGTSEGGIFIWDKELLGSPVPVIASVIMAELTFNLLGLEKTFAEIRTDNKASINYNKLLGYETLEVIEEEKKAKLVLTRDNFHSKGKKFLEVIRKASGCNSSLSWENISFETVTPDERKQLYNGFPAHIQKSVDSRFK